MTRLPTILMACFCSLACLPAADLVITGTWMAQEISSGGGTGEGKSSGKFSMRCKPGFMTIEIGDGTLKTSLAMPSRPAEVKTSTYTVQSRSADRVAITVIDPTGKKPPKPTELVKDGPGLTITGDGAVMKVVPYDAAAIAAEQKRQSDAEQPAEPLKDAPLSGHLGGADWTPVLARRSSFQFDKTGKRIRVEVTADKPKGFEPSAKSSLILNIPTTVGEYPLGNTFNITAYTPPSTNAMIANGILTVYSVSDTAIAFGLTARGEDGDVVNGRMTADVSPLKDE